MPILRVLSNAIVLAIFCYTAEKKEADRAASFRP
jgi:hypothetical protein